MSSFKLIKTDSSSKARLGQIETAHGVLDTPVFMPVGTRGCVKTLLPSQLKEIGAKIILGNTYHLLIRPGIDILKKAGGLHAFMNWEGAILTDSGGFQVFSLASLNKVTDEGVHFQSHIDGAPLFLGPTESMAMQKVFGSDIVMAFDQCHPYPCEKEEVKKGMTRTHLWATKCREYPLQPHQKLFGIVQGGMYPELRRESASQLTALGFDGYAIGGLSVGEPTDMMYQILEETLPSLPDDKPRYLMGVGTPRNLVEAVRRGVDMFDCVLPTRNARNGTAFTWQGKINIKAGRYTDDFSPLDPKTSCYTTQFSKAYLRHLLNVGEITGLTLVTLQNLAFYLDFMHHLRKAIAEDTFADFYKQVCEIYP